MADSSDAITAGSGTPVRVLTGLGAGVAHQQVVTLADSAGVLQDAAGYNHRVVPQAATPVTTGVAANVASVTLIAANATNRKALMVTNSRASSGILYVKSDGGTASIASAGYSLSLVPGQSYEYMVPPVTAVVGIWDSSTTGYALITETT